MPDAKEYWKDVEFFRADSRLRDEIRKLKGQKGGLNPPAYSRLLEKQKALRRGDEKWAVLNRAHCKKWRAKVIAATGGATARHNQMYKLIREKEKPRERKQKAQRLKEAKAELKKLWTERHRQTRGWRKRKKKNDAVYIVKFFNAAWHRDFERGAVIDKKSSKKILSKKS